MKRALKSGLLVVALAGVAALATGCADDQLMRSDFQQANDFGRAVNEDLTAQIADPDAVYKGPMPPSSGEQAAMAQKRYATDKMKEPKAESTQSSGGSSGGSGGGSAGGSSGGSGGS